MTNRRMNTADQVDAICRQFREWEKDPDSAYKETSRGVFSVYAPGGEYVIRVTYNTLGSATMYEDGEVVYDGPDPWYGYFYHVYETDLAV